jgi:hypothetical protein
MNVVTSPLFVGPRQFGARTNFWGVISSFTHGDNFCSKRSKRDLIFPAHVRNEYVTTHMHMNI